MDRPRLSTVARHAKYAAYTDGFVGARKEGRESDHPSHLKDARAAPTKQVAPMKNAGKDAAKSENPRVVKEPNLQGRQPN